MLFVFDDRVTTSKLVEIPSGRFKEFKRLYQPNICSGTNDLGLFGHGGLLVDLAMGGAELNAKLVNEIDDGDSDMYYLIEPWPSFTELKPQHGSNIAMPLSWATVIYHIPQRVRDLSNQKRLTILLHIPEYTSGLHAIDYRINEAVRQIRIDPAQFKFISGMQSDYFYYWPAFEYSQYICYYKNPALIKNVNLLKRTKKFTCLNRIDKAHRRYIGVRLVRNGLENDGYFSYSFSKFSITGIKETTEDDDIIPYWNTSIKWNIDQKEWESFRSHGKYIADNRSVDEHNDHWYIEQSHYDDAYWNFITETSIDDNPFLTEKTFKPLANLQPFIILGSYKSLELLHDLGYKTFGAHIDEGYDDIMDHTTRVKAATDQAIKLAKMSHEEHIELMTKIKPILEHNQQHFFSSKNRLSKFVKYLTEGNPAANWLR